MYVIISISYCRSARSVLPKTSGATNNYTSSGEYHGGSGSGGSGSRHSVTFVTQSLQPLAFLVEPFELISAAECNHIVTLTSPILEASDVNHFDHDIGLPSTKWRRSLQARLPNGYDPVISAINQRVAAALRLPLSHLEPLQALKYEVGGKYDAHWDYFDPALYKDQRVIMDMIDGDGSRNRIATVLLYLNDVHNAGGETFFPRAGGLMPPLDVLCEQAAGMQGMKIIPSLAKALVFYSLRPDGAIDPFSLHGSCPITTPDATTRVSKIATQDTSGSNADTIGDESPPAHKWVASQRVWTKPYRP